MSAVYDTYMITSLMLLLSSGQIPDDELTYSWPIRGGLGQRTNPGSSGDRDGSSWHGQTVVTSLKLTFIGVSRYLVMKADISFWKQISAV